jgi:hypothetical protein
LLLPLLCCPASAAGGSWLPAPSKRNTCSSRGRGWRVRRAAAWRPASWQMLPKPHQPLLSTHLEQRVVSTTCDPAAAGTPRDGAQLRIAWDGNLLAAGVGAQRRRAQHAREHQQQPALGNAERVIHATRLAKSPQEGKHAARSACSGRSPRWPDQHAAVANCGGSNCITVKPLWMSQKKITCALDSPLAMPRTAVYLRCCGGVGCTSRTPAGAACCHGGSCVRAL